MIVMCACSSPKGPLKAAEWSTDRQIQLRVKRRRSGEFISFFEQLVVSGYEFDEDDTIPNIRNHLLRDLPAPKPFLISPYATTVRASTAGAKLSARSAITPNRVLAARNPEQLLAQATPDELVILEACLPDLLVAQSEVRSAKAHARSACRYVKLLEKTDRLMKRLYSHPEATPGQQQRTRGVRELLAGALTAYRQAEAQARVESLLLRRAQGLPMLRTWDANRRRYKLALDHKRYPRWWDTIRQRKPVSDLRRGFKAPPRWRDLDDGGLVYMHVAGAYAHGRVVPFTINLTDEVEARARASPLPAGWLRDRIDRRIRQRLGRRVEILVGLEFNKKERLHGHGVLTPVPLADEGEVREALKLAGGKGYKGEQVRLNKNQPDSGWASYIAKGYDQPFPWTRFVATRGLQASAKAILGKMRRFVLAINPNI